MEVLLRFCSRCGAPVVPYRPSTLSLADMRDYGTVPDEPDAEPHYECGRCGSRWLAVNLVDPGSTCPECGIFMPLAADCCAACGTRLRQ
jgi:DNA-directed RNA polymerase subunit RPC12/RpoP